MGQLLIELGKRSWFNIEETGDKRALETFDYVITVNQNVRKWCDENLSTQVITAPFDDEMVAYPYLGRSNRLGFIWPKQEANVDSVKYFLARVAGRMRLPSQPLLTALSRIRVLLRACLRKFVIRQIANSQLRRFIRNLIRF